MATGKSVVVVVMLSAIISSSQAQTMPTGCTYDAGLYECDYTLMSGSSLVPIQASGFSPVPQRVRLVGLPTSLSSAVFDTDFASINGTDFDTNYPASLELVCEYGASLSVSSGFLANMDLVEDFKITNCDLGNIPANAFSELGVLDRFMIENGTINSITTGALTGLSIVRNISVDPTYPKQHGALIIKNTKLTSGSLPTDFLAGQTNLYQLVLRNMNLTSVDAALLADSTANNIRYLDLSNNRFTSLPSDLFSNQDNLGVITLYGFDIDCTCSNLWFMQHAHLNYLTLEGDIICNSDKKLAWAYYYSNCVTAEATCTSGIALMDACLTMIDLAGFSVGLIAFVMGWVVLGITINTRNKLNPSKGKGGKKPGTKRVVPNKPPKGGWA